MSGIVICVVCGDTWEVPDEAYPPNGRSICDRCDPNGDSLGSGSAVDWDNPDIPGDDEIEAV